MTNQILGEAEDTQGWIACEPRRRRLTACAFELRGYTALAELAPADEVIAILGDFYDAVGRVADRCRGTVQHVAGRGVSAFFAFEGDAMRAAVGLGEELEPLRRCWKRMGHELDVAMGLAQGYATVGAVVHNRSRQVVAVGAVATLAERLAARAAGGEILLTERLAEKVGDTVKVEDLGSPRLEGFLPTLRVARLLALDADALDAAPPSDGELGRAPGTAGREIAARPGGC